MTKARPASLAYAWFVVAVLSIANGVSFIDRLILSLLVQPIKSELALSDKQFGLLAGAAFSILYATAGLAIARLADRYSRKWIITAGVTLWCCMTAITSTATSYLRLFTYRVGVGIGEATLSPSAYSLIAAYFAPQRLALAVGIFSAGITAGTGLAFILGGVLIKWVSAQGILTIPLLGPLAGWRLTMAMVGLLGLPVTLLLLCVREPARAPAFVPATLADVLQHFRGDWQRYTLVFVGYGATSITAFSLMAWTPALYARQYHASPIDAALTIGIVALCGGVLGSFLGGAWADHLERGGDRNAKLRVLLYCAIGMLLPPVVAPFLPSVRAHAALIFFTFLFGGGSTGPAGSYIQSITPDPMRAQFGAAHHLALTLFGATVAPFAVGALSDYFGSNSHALGWSMAIVSGVANPFAAWFLFKAFRLAQRRSNTA